MNCRGYGELIAAHVDGVLYFEEGREAQSHVDECATCRRIFVWERKAQNVIKPHLVAIAPPSGVKERILDNLNRKGRSREMVSWFFHSPRLAGSFALVMVVVLTTILWRNNSKEDLLSQAAAQYQMMTRGNSKFPSSSPSRAARSFDLSPWGYHLLTSEVSATSGLTGITSTYRNERSDYLLAQEFEGGNLSVPAGAKSLQVAGKTFIIHSENGVNLIAWKERNLFCILASRVPLEQLLDIAQRVMR
jgi:hypothetical protein